MDGRIGEGITAFFLAEDDLPRLVSLPGVETFCFFCWLHFLSVRLGVFSLLCSDGAVVFLGAIFLTVMERLTAGAIAILSLALTLALSWGDELNRADRLLCELSIVLESAIALWNLSIIPSKIKQFSEFNNRYRAVTAVVRSKLPARVAEKQRKTSFR